MHVLDDYPHGNLRLTTATTITALNIFYLPEFISWKLEERWKLLNKFPAGAGMIDLHLAYWPPQLNCKVLPKWFKRDVTDKFEEFYMSLKKIFKKNNSIVVAEIGNNHEGDFNQALKLIDAASMSGADAVKFQTY